MRKFLATMALALATGVSTPALASELGGGVYPNGAEGYSGAAMPPPGTYLLGYLQHYEADRFNGPDGEAGLLPNFRVRADAAVIRVVHMTPVKILGATWGMQAIVPVTRLKVGAAGLGDETTGVGDVTVDPILLGWHFQNGVHLSAGVDINLPVGAYDRRKLSNIGRNYLNFEPVVALAYYGKKGFSVDVKVMYDINTRNDQAVFTPFNPTGASYRSGNELHADFAVGQQIGKWKLGASGYVYKQTTKDQVSDPTAQAFVDQMRGFKGQVIGVGPSASYQAGKVQLIGSWQHEFHAENRPQGDKFWLKAIIPIGR